MKEARNPFVAVSIIVPTHNRRSQLERLLRALEQQDAPSIRFELVVVADGCSDDTVDMLRCYSGPLSIRMSETPGLGPAGARNAGASAAGAPLLIFLDDDIEPVAGFVAAHVAAHKRKPGGVVIGPYPPLPHAASDPFRLLVRHWWNDHFASLARPGHRFSYRDVLTGNISMRASLWRAIGGLDPAFRKAREDLELGVRLIGAGVPLLFEPQALGWHYEHETMTVEGAFRRAMEEGLSDAMLGIKHPRIRPTLRHVALGRSLSRRRRLLYRAFFRAHHRLDLLALLAARLFPLLDSRGLRRSYLRLYRALIHYWYMRGIADHFRRMTTWLGHVREGDEKLAEPIATVDLRVGLAAAEAYLDHVRPQRLMLQFGGKPLGLLPETPGSERWHGAHLRPMIARHFAAPYLKGAVLSGAACNLAPADRERVATRVGRLASLVGPWFMIDNCRRRALEASTPPRAPLPGPPEAGHRSTPPKANRADAT